MTKAIVEATKLNISIEFIATDKLTKQSIGAVIQAAAIKMGLKADDIKVHMGREGDTSKKKVLDLLSQKPMTIKQLAAKLKINAPNVSSQLTYLRKKHDILLGKNSSQEYVIENKQDKDGNYLNASQEIITVT